MGAVGNIPRDTRITRRAAKYRHLEKHITPALVLSWMSNRLHTDKAYDQQSSLIPRMGIESHLTAVKYLSMKFRLGDIEYLHIIGGKMCSKPVCLLDFLHIIRI